MRDRTASRRQFLIGSAAGVSAAWMALRWPAILAAGAHARQAAESGQAAFEFFASEQAAEVEAMAAQIIPSDETPGAREARVIYFIDRALATFERDKQAMYRQGLKDLQIKAGKMFAGNQRFSDLSPEQQIQLLTAIQGTEFFYWLRVHTVMGFLARPEYGGNQNKVGWKAIGFEDKMMFEPPFGYYDREYQKNKR